MPHCSRQDDTKMRFVWSNAHFVCCLISTRVIELAEIVPFLYSFQKFEFYQNWGAPKLPLTLPTKILIWTDQVE